MDVASSSTENREVRSNSNPEMEGDTTMYQEDAQRRGLPGLPGCIYQLKLLMLFLKRGVDLNYRFRLGTEIEAAEKFDDLVLEITTEDNKIVYRLFQAKHKENESSENISFRDLLTDIDGPYSLVKYFHTYQDAKVRDIFKRGFIEDVTLCTNINLNFKSKLNRLKKLKFDSKITIRDTVEDIDIVKRDNILGMEKEELTKISVRYMFNENIVEPLTSALLDYDLPKLAERLAICVLNKQPIEHCTDTFFKIYHGVLSKEVIDTHNKQFFVKFVDGSSDVCDTCRFRDMFKKKISKISPKTDFNKINDYILKDKFAVNLSTGFGEGGENSWSPLKHIKEFLKHLVFAVNLPNENELGVIIQNNIGREFNFAATKHVYNDVFIKMLDWLKSKGDGFISYEDGKRLFDKSKKTLYGFGLDGFTWECQSIIDKYNIIFKQEATEALQLNEFLSQNKPSKQILRIITTQNTLSAVKVCGILNSVPEYKKCYSKIFMNIDNVLNIQPRVIQTFEESSINLCVIICNPHERNIVNLCNQLCNIIRKNRNKKLVLITDENDPLANYFKCYSAIPDKYVEKTDNCNAFINLTSVSQKKLLEEKKVIFQGKEISLGTLIDEESKDLIREDVLFKLISDEKMEIGNPPSTLGEEEHYYIQRKFNRSVEINEKFTSFSYSADEPNLHNDNTFLITYNSEDINLNEGLDIVLISSSESDFNIVCDKDKERRLNIHWLKKEDKAFVWQQTHGSLSKLREFVNFENTRIYEPQNVGDMNDKIVIIAADSGMGKSTVLTFLALQSKNSDPDLWIERIDLHKHTKRLNEVQFDNKHIAINFLLDVLKFKTSFERELFKYRVHKQGTIALLLDGFDEISPYYKKQVFNLLKILSGSTSVKHLWVTTRPHIESEIEETFGMFSYDLQPLSKKEQKSFLKYYLSKALDSSSLNKNRLSAYTAGLLRLLSESTVTVDDKKEFCGIPLHLRMLADVFVKDFKEYHDSNGDKLNLPEELDLIDLYDKFIKNKFDIYWEEKNERNETKPSTIEERVKLYGLFILEHKIIALNTLFPGHNVLDNIISIEEKNTMENFRRRLSQEEERTGIVSIINETTCFTHRSFAEYLAVEFISDKLKSSYSTENVWNFLINTIFNKDDCPNEKIFFSGKLKKDNELSNLFSEKIEATVKLLFIIDEKEILVNVFNFLIEFDTKNSVIFNRIISSDILSTVVGRGHKDIAEILLSYVRNTDEERLLDIINVGDDEFSIPLQVAIQNNNEEMIDVLLKDVEDTDQLEEILNFGSSHGFSALCCAVDNDCLADGTHTLFEYIKKLKPDQRYKVICTSEVMETDFHGEPLGDDMSPMNRAKVLAGSHVSSDPQVLNLSILLDSISDESD